jgi:hypothetical protein
VKPETLESRKARTEICHQSCLPSLSIPYDFLNKKEINDPKNKQKAIDNDRRALRQDGAVTDGDGYFTE